MSEKLTAALCRKAARTALIEETFGFYGCFFEHVRDSLSAVGKSNYLLSVLGYVVSDNICDAEQRCLALLFLAEMIETGDA